MHDMYSWTHVTDRVVFVCGYNVHGYRIIGFTHKNPSLD